MLQIVAEFSKNIFRHLCLTCAKVGGKAPSGVSVTSLLDIFIGDSYPGIFFLGFNLSQRTALHMYTGTCEMQLNVHLAMNPGFRRFADHSKKKKDTQNAA